MIRGSRHDDYGLASRAWYPHEAVGNPSPSTGGEASGPGRQLERAATDGTGVSWFRRLPRLASEAQWPPLHAPQVLHHALLWPAYIVAVGRGLASGPQRSIREETVVWPAPPTTVKTAESYVGRRRRPICTVRHGRHRGTRELGRAS